MKKTKRYLLLLSILLCYRTTEVESFVPAYPDSDLVEKSWESIQQGIAKNNSFDDNQQRQRRRRRNLRGRKFLEEEV